MTWRRETSCPYQDLNLEPLVVHSIVSRYTNRFPGSCFNIYMDILGKSQKKKQLRMASTNQNYVIDPVNKI
jgi:hypothetical protein